jgi:hypothetical protein
MWISHSRWLPGSKKYSKWLKFKKKSSLKAHGRIKCYIVGIFLRWSTSSFVFFMRIWNLTQKRIVLRTRSGNASINRTSHFLDTQIQACTNEDPSVSGVRTLRSKVCIGCNGTRNHVSSRTMNDNTMAWFCCEDSLVSNLGSGVMIFNVTFNNISVISWQSVLLEEETGENHRPVASHFQTLSHNVVTSTPHQDRDSNWRQWW